MSPLRAYDMPVPVYAISRTGIPLVAASFHPWGAEDTVRRARDAGVEVSADGKLVDGEWLREDMRMLRPDWVPMLSALLIAVVQQGLLLSEMQRMQQGGRLNAVS